MKLVIFDLDGVIVSTDEYHYEAWNTLADEYNLLFSTKINHLLRGVSRAESLKIILDMNGRVVNSVEFSEMLEKKNRIYKDKLQNLTPLDILPGVLELLLELKRSGILIAIGSSSKNAPLILKRIGLQNSFDAIVDGNSISKSKPDPEVFLKCAKKLHIEPAFCLVYEDAAAGIEAAIAADMTAVGVGSENLQDAHRMAYDLTNESLQTILGGINE